MLQLCKQTLIYETSSTILKQGKSMAVINGTAGADALIGTTGDDEINALGGNDVIKGTAGADKIDGGAGLDTVDYSASTEGISIDLRQGAGLVGRGSHL